MPRHPPAAYLRALEAAVLLAGAGLALRLLPFRRLVPLLGTATPTTRGAAPEPRTVAAAVERAARRLPWRPVCFPQGLATHWMLRRRGIDSRLHYGIRPDGARLSAHVWVEVNGEVVIGAEEAASAHREVAVFPAR